MFSVNLITKKIDGMGRLGIPKAVREFLNVKNMDEVDFVLEENGTVTLKKHEEKCIFCGEIDNLTECNGKKICKSCFDKIKV